MAPLVFFALLLIALVALLRKLIKDCRLQRERKREIFVAFNDFCAVADLIVIYEEDPSGGVVKIMNLMPHCLRVDRAFKHYIDKRGIESNEHFALRTMADLEYDTLRRAIDDAQQDTIWAEKKLRGLLPECQRVDSQVTEFCEPDKRREYLCLEAIVKCILNSGDIEADVPVTA